MRSDAFSSEVDAAHARAFECCCGARLGCSDCLVYDFTLAFCLGLHVPGTGRRLPCLIACSTQHGMSLLGLLILLRLNHVLLGFETSLAWVDASLAWVDAPPA